MKVHGDGGFPTDTLTNDDDDERWPASFEIFCSCMQHVEGEGAAAVCSVCILLLLHIILYTVASRCALHQWKYKYKYKYMDFLFFFRVSYDEEDMFFAVNEFCRTILWFMNFLYLKRTYRFWRF